MQHADRRAALAPQSILVVLPTWVGDFVMASPTLRAIRNRFTKAKITFLLTPNLRDLVTGGDWMDECIEWPTVRTRSVGDGPTSIVDCRFLRGSGQVSIGDCVGRAARPRTWLQLVKVLRLRRFDLAVLLPNSFRAALIARLSGAKRRIGYDRDGRGLLLTDRIPVKSRRGRCDESQFPSTVRTGSNLPVRVGRFVPMPLVECYADLAEAIGCERPGDRLELFATPDGEESVQRRLESLGLADRHPLVVISPGAKFGASKCWLPERFAAVADHLIESEGATVIITCGPGEESIGRAIGAAMKQHGFLFDSPWLTLGELKSLVRRSDLLICNDAGPRHIAKAFDVPVVAVFGPTHPDWTSTSYGDERIVRIDVDCGPCQQRVCPLEHHQCMTGVTVDMVFAAAVALLHLRTPEHARAR